MKKRLIKGVKIALFVLFVIVLGGFIYLNMNTYDPSSEASALLDHEQVQVLDDYYLVVPIYEEIGTFVYYPGGLVKPASYLPFALKMAEEGIRVIVMKMPLNLAILNNDAYLSIDELDMSGPVLLGGHSLGGASASLFLRDYTDIDGLVFLASYPAESANLGMVDYPVLSIRASLDGVMNLSAYEEAKSLLPAHTVYKVIEGGNHAQFGDYGAQSGDSEASISRDEQQMQVVEYIKELLLSLSQ